MQAGYCNIGSNTPMRFMQRSAAFPRPFQLAWAKASITRNGARRHEMEFIDIRNKDFLEIDCRSILGFILVYNHLPGTVVAANFVLSFQCNVQTLVKQRALDGCHDWMVIISQLLPVNEHPLR